MEFDISSLRDNFKVTKKPWGEEILWANTEFYAAKILIIHAGKKLSLQSHNKKTETMYFNSGEAILVIGNSIDSLNKIRVNAGNSIHIPKNTVHRIEAITDVEIFEVSTTELDDVVRYEDEYGRAT